MSAEAIVLEWRKATPADHAFLCHLMERTLLVYLHQAEPGSEGQWEEAFRFYVGFWKWRVISINGTSVAAVAGGDHFGVTNIESLCVLPEYQNRGIGGEILRQLIARSHARNWPVRLEVLKSNERAQRFYQRFGFETTGSSRIHFEMVLRPPERPGFWKSSAALLCEWLRDLRMR